MDGRVAHKFHQSFTKTLSCRPAVLLGDQFLTVTAASLLLALAKSSSANSVSSRTPMRESRYLHRAFSRTVVWCNHSSGDWDIRSKLQGPPHLARRKVGALLSSPRAFHADLPVIVRLVPRVV